MPDLNHGKTQTTSMSETTTTQTAPMRSNLTPKLESLSGMQCQDLQVKISQATAMLNSMRLNLQEMELVQADMAAKIRRLEMLLDGMRR